MEAILLNIFVFITHINMAERDHTVWDGVAIFIERGLFSSSNSSKTRKDFCFSR